MTINNLAVFVGSLWNWKFLERYLGGSIAPSDIDGIVERNGQFLILEGKSRGTPIPKGQKIMFENLLNTGLCTVVILWGEPNKPEKMMAVSHDFKKVVINPASEKDIQEYIGKWYRKACEQSKQKYQGIFD